jgi:hypothetical protein
MRVRGRNVNCTRRVPNSRKPKRRARWRTKSRVCVSFYLASRELFTNNSSWEAMQSILHTYVTIYDDCGRMCEDFAPNFGDIKTGCCVTTAHHLTFPFHQGSSNQKERDYRSPPTLLFSVSPISDKIERPQFWHNWGNRGRIAMLNTLADYDFQDAIRKRQNRWKRCTRTEGHYFGSDGGQ